MKFSIGDFFSRWLHLMKKSLMENLIFLCSVRLAALWRLRSNLFHSIAIDGEKEFPLLSGKLFGALQNKNFLTVSV